MTTPVTPCQTASSNLSIRLATGPDDIAAVQHLRWKVFHDEMGAQGASGLSTHLDADVYDPLCDHLLVIHTGKNGKEDVVGTYRLLRETVAKSSFGFYSSGEFDIDLLVSGPARPVGELLELGRSCVLARGGQAPRSSCCGGALPTISSSMASP